MYVCVMSLPRKAEGYPTFGALNTIAAYQHLGMVYPEIWAGYVGVSELSLEFVCADISGLTNCLLRDPRRNISTQHMILKGV